MSKKLRDLNPLKKRRGPGRDRLSKHLLKSKTVAVNLSISEHQRLDKARGGYAIATYARDLINKGVDEELRERMK